MPGSSHKSPNRAASDRKVHHLRESEKYLVRDPDEPQFDFHERLAREIDEMCSFKNGIRSFPEPDLKRLLLIRAKHVEAIRRTASS